MTETDCNYYVYIYLDPLKPSFTKNGLEFSHEPIYVGCGTKNRLNDHLSQAKNREFIKVGNKYKFFKIKQILSLGQEPIIIKYKENIDRLTAFSIEKELINRIGLSINNDGPLTNLVEGGRINPCLVGEKNPMYGVKWSEERRKDFSEKIKNRNKNLSKDEYDKLYKGRTVTDNTRMKLSNASKGINNPNYGKKRSNETCEKISEANIGKFADENNPRARDWIVSDPDNNHIETKSLMTLCRKYNLNMGSLISAGKRNTKVKFGPSKGWSAVHKPFDK